MRTTGIKVVGIKEFSSKKGDKYKIAYYVSGAFEQGVEGVQAGYMFVDPSLDLEVDQNYTGILGYDRSGKYGIVDIME